MINHSTWDVKLHGWRKHEAIQGTPTFYQVSNWHKVLLLKDETRSKPKCTIVVCVYIDAYYKGYHQTENLDRICRMISWLVISYQSQSHKTVALSVTEAEYSEIMEICCELLFIYEILFFHCSSCLIPHYRAHW